MCDWSLGLGTLSKESLGRLADMLDNSNCGWRQLAAFVNEQPRFKCSESELTSCSLQVLSPTGSPGKYLLARLADRSCSLALLLHWLKKMDYHEAVQFLTATVMEQIQITLHPKAQKASEGDMVVLSCRAIGRHGLTYQWFRGKEEVCQFVMVKGKKGMVKDILKSPEVCTDPVRLTSYAVGANIFKQGEDPPLKPREEYPEWLFQLRLGPPKKVSELEPDTREYWKVMRKEHMWRFNRLNKGKKF